MTPELRELGILSLNEKHDDKRREALKTIFSFEKGKSSERVERVFKAKVVFFCHLCQISSRDFQFAQIFERFFC